MNLQPIGDILDARGLAIDLDPDDLLVSAVVVAAIMIPGESTPRISIGITEGLGPIEQTGLLAAAKAITESGWAEAHWDDED